MNVFRSRSNSRSSQNSDREVASPPSPPASPLITAATSREEDDNLPLTVTKIDNSSEPLADIITALADKINSIIDLKGKGKISLLDIPSIKDIYSSKSAADNILLEKRLEQSSKETKDKIINSQLNTYNLYSLVNPPKSFPKEPALVKPSISYQLLNFFPRKPYSGERDGKILEFLNSMCLAQARAKLNEEEFLDVLCKTTSGLAHRLVVNLRQQGEPVDKIFACLVSTFYNGPTSSTARNLLHSLKATRADTMMKLHERILDLSQCASRLFVEGEARKIYFNNLACLSLIQALPNTGYINAHHLTSQIYHQLSNTLDGPPSFSDFTNALIPYHEQLNHAIRLHGESPRFKEVRNKEKFTTRDFARKNNYYKPRIFNANVFGQRESANSENVDNFNNRGNNYGNRMPNRNSNFRSNNYSANNGYRSGYGKGNNTNYRRNWNNNNNNFSRGRKNEKFCLICGNRGHSASEGCTKYIKDGIPRILSPTQAPCPNCLKISNKKCFHPENMCFLKRD